MKLLRVRASNYKNCCDDLTIDFVAKSKKTSEDKEYELQEIAEDLYVLILLHLSEKMLPAKRPQ